MVEQQPSSLTQSMHYQMLEAANETYADYLSSGEKLTDILQKEGLKKLRNIIERVKKEDFGIYNNPAANAVIFADKNTISYVNIHSEIGERFSFGLFFIPKGGLLPLHDHPNMFVFSKILMGSVKRQSFSLSNRSIQFNFAQANLSSSATTNTNETHSAVNGRAEKNVQQKEECSQNGNLRDDTVEGNAADSSKNIKKEFTLTIEAKLDSEEILKEGFIDDLDPIHKNLHQIEAVEDCVFFDVLLPHYDLMNSRNCNYYTVLEPPDLTTGKTVLKISKQPIYQGKVQYFSIERSCNYFC